MTDIPASIGGFAVIGVLGEGGMGAVYECRDASLDRLVAIKVLRADLAQSADATVGARFLREARTLAKVSSPHVVAIHSLGEHEGRPFIVMERLQGEDLGRTLQSKGPLGVDQVRAIAADTIAGLAAASAAGIVHRDIKPSNLFVVNGRVKVTDFGLAVPVDGSASLTSAGLVVGTPHYLAPEVGRGSPASIASDVYALGATLLELLIGRPVFGGKTPLDALAAHIIEPVPDVKKLVPAAAALAPMLEKMLQKKPEARFQSWDDVAAALQAASGDAPAAPAPTAVVPQPPAPLPSSTMPTTTSPASLPPGEHSGSSVRSETLTVMLTDIAGYTERTSRQSREEAARWLELHDALLKPVMRAFRGTIVKSIGDALLVTFRSPTNAVLCGTAIQDRLFAHNKTAADSDRIEVRVALSAGEVRLHRGDIFGEPVNLCARLEGIGERGEVLLTDAVYATMNAAEVKLASRGEHSFKGIGRPVHVYAAVPDGVAGEAPFGNRALARVKDTPSLASVVDAPVVRDVVTRARELLVRVPSLPRKQLSIASAVVASIAVFLFFWTRPSLTEAEQRALLALSEEDAREARKLLTESKDEDVDEALVEIVNTSNEWWPRHHAKDVLEARGKLALIDAQAFAIRDLREGEGCPRRQMGLRLLKRTARDEQALAAIEEAKKLPLGETWCMSFEIDGVLRAIKKQLEGK